MIAHEATDINHALYLASLGNHLNIVLYLLDQGADDLNEALLGAGSSDSDTSQIIDVLINRGATNLSEVLLAVVD